MRFKFAWNEFADQPHNVAPRSERTRHHRPVAIEREMFAAAVSPRPGRDGEVLALLEEAGVREALLRIPSWEKDRLAEYEAFARLARSRGIGLAIALLQRREDVFEAAAWARFVEDVFARFSPVCRHFEIGHAWNRTKWGVWDYTEYLALARPAFALREKYGVKLVGPAVIDFEFHLYPPTLRALPFVTDVHPDEDGISITVQDAGRHLQELLNRAGTVEAVEVRPVTLEDVFLHTTGRVIREGPAEGGWAEKVMAAGARR